MYLFERKTRDVIKFAMTLTVYLIGTTFLGQIEARWMALLWHFIHLGGMFILVSAGLLDWFFGVLKNHEQLKVYIGELQATLISPVLYVGMGIVNQRLGNRFKLG